ncbi:hypothetical protein DSECCO2_375640 [anaerobic digester metagenome]
MFERKKRKRFRINDDTMTTIVVSSLFFCVGVVIAGMLLAYIGVDVSTIVGSALTVFGTELGICGVMTIFNRWADRQDKIIQRRRESREKRKNEQRENQ